MCNNTTKSGRITSDETVPIKTLTHTYIAHTIVKYKTNKQTKKNKTKKKERNVKFAT